MAAGLLKQITNAILKNNKRIKRSEQTAKSVKEKVLWIELKSLQQSLVIKCRWLHKKRGAIRDTQGPCLLPYDGFTTSIGTLPSRKPDAALSLWTNPRAWGGEELPMCSA